VLQDKVVELERRQNRTLLRMARESGCWLTRIAAEQAAQLLAQGYPTLARLKLLANLKAEAQPAV